jgi:hypothetical protein
MPLWLRNEKKVLSLQSQAINSGWLTDPVTIKPSYKLSDRLALSLQYQATISDWSSDPVNTDPSYKLPDWLTLSLQNLPANSLTDWLTLLTHWLTMTYKTKLLTFWHIIFLVDYLSIFIRILIVRIKLKLSDWLNLSLQKQASSTVVDWLSLSFQNHAQAHWVTTFTTEPSFKLSGWLTATTEPNFKLSGWLTVTTEPSFN